MPDSWSLEHLLQRWEQDQIPPEELCRDCPELLPELQRRITAHQETGSFDRDHDGSTHTDIIVQLLERWQKQNQEGHSITPEELCRDHPELLSRVSQEITRTETHSYKQKADRLSIVPDTADSTPAMIGRYQLKHRLGQGSFGQVWHGFDTHLKRDVAIKLPRTDRDFTPQQIEDFLTEARRMASLRHPGLVPVYDIGHHDGVWYIVSELIDGTSLAAQIAREPLTPDQAAQVVAEVAEALHHAHLRGFIHRDVKPGNILIDRQGSSFLTDFGLATTEEEQLTLGRGVAGTLAYMSPEQARGQTRHLDGRSDIYSLGVVLFELLTSRRPFKATSLSDYLDQVLHRDVRPPRSIDDRIPVELERITLKCLSRSITERYTTASDLATDLRRWLDTVRQPEGGSRFRLLAMAMVAVLLMSGLGVIWGLSDRGTKTDRPDVVSPSIPAGHHQEDNPRLLHGVRDLDGCRPLKWYALLDRTPSPDLWPTGDGLSRWDHDRDAEELAISLTRDSALFAFGSTNADSYTIQMNVAQGLWTGGVGVYFGYRDFDVPDPPEGKDETVAEFQFIQFHALSQENAGRFSLVRGRAVIRHSQVGNAWVKMPSPRSMMSTQPLPQLRNEQPLELVIESGRLARVRVGVVEFPELVTPALNNRFAPESYHGRFGAVSFGASCFYRNVRYMAHDSPTPEAGARSDD